MPKKLSASAHRIRFNQGSYVKNADNHGHEYVTKHKGGWNQHLTTTLEADIEARMRPGYMSKDAFLEESMHAHGLSGPPRHPRHDGFGYGMMGMPSPYGMVPDPNLMPGMMGMRPSVGEAGLGPRRPTPPAEQIVKDIRCFGPFPTRPCPATPQYGYADKRVSFPISMPAMDIHFEGRVEAKLRNNVDLHDGYQRPGGWDYYWARIDGWVLNFWLLSTFDRRSVARGFIQPSGWVDLRRIHNVDWEEEASMGCEYGYCVNLKLMNGYLAFRVPTPEEAQVWVDVIFKLGIEEFTRIQELANIDSLDAALHQDEDSVRNNPGVRMAPLRDIWVRCLRSTAAGGQPPETAALEIFHLYDVNEDRECDMQELERMVKDLVYVRMKELTEAIDMVEDEEKEALRGGIEIRGIRDGNDTDFRTSLLEAKNLKVGYEERLKPDKFKRWVLKVYTQLDISNDGKIELREFSHKALNVLLPSRELKLEADFYKSIGSDLVDNLTMEEQQGSDPCQMQ